MESAEAFTAGAGCRYGLPGPCWGWLRGGTAVGIVGFDLGLPWLGEGKRHWRCLCRSICSLGVADPGFHLAVRMSGQLS